jgi:5-methyltetrahydropteroyltriglutamate--homocysteine methyltransferase
VPGRGPRHSRTELSVGTGIVNDGEQHRAGSETYVGQRMTESGGGLKRSRPLDIKDVPGFAKQVFTSSARHSRVSNAPHAFGNVCYDDLSIVTDECAMFRAALHEHGVAPNRAFMNSASPGIITTTLLNTHYDTKRPTSSQ